MADSERLRDAIEWFDNLPSSKKERIIEEFGSNLATESAGYFWDIVYVIRDSVSFENTESGVGLLTDSGMGSLFAEKFVDKVVDRLPPNSLVMAELNELDQEEFQQIVELSIRQYTEAVSDENIYEGIETKQTTPYRLRETIQGLFMQILRGEYSADLALRRTVELGLKRERAEYMTETIYEYEDLTWKRLVLYNTWKIINEDIPDLRDQQREIRGLLDQLLTIVEDAARSTDT